MPRSAASFEAISVILNELDNLVDHRLLVRVDREVTIEHLNQVIARHGE